MKKLFKFIGLCFLILSSFLHSCKKKEILTVPTVITSPITNITETTAIGGGTVTNEGSGPVIERGICWSKGITPTIGSNITIEEGGAGTYSSNMKNLNSLTTFIVRAYATNKIGTGYGDEISFQTAPPKINFSDWITYGNLTDQEGNNYRTVKIGEQTWMAENLRTTHYQNGNKIPNITNLDSWIFLNTGAYCFYNNDILNKNAYGALYNWYTVMDQSKICPSGWHVPSDPEWSILEDFLGGSNFAGQEVKEAGLIHWVRPNIGASNLSGFSALPAGLRAYTINDDFLGLGYYCMWWSSSEHHTFDQSAWYRFLSTFESALGKNYYLKRAGFSIRCVKD